MYEIYLDSLKLREEDIRDFDGIYTTRTLNGYYFGYLNGEGFADSESNYSITIENPVAVALINSQIESGFNKDLELKIGYNGVFDSFLIDYSSYKENGCCSVSVGLKPKTNALSILLKEKVDYRVDFDEEIEVPSRPYLEDATLSVYGELAGNGASLNHTIPTDVKNTDELYSVGVLDNKPFFISKKTQCVALNIAITFKAEVTADSIVTLCLLKNDLEVYSEDYNLSTTFKDYNIALNDEIDLTSNDELKLVFKGTNAGLNYRFEYQEQSFIGIGACGYSIETETYKVKAISVKKALSLLLLKIGNLELAEYIFDSELFEGYLTNNVGLKGEDSYINISLYDLFEEINNKYPASLSEKDGKIYLKSRECFINEQPIFYLNVESENREINTDSLVTSLKVGYNNWRDTTDLGFLEINADRQFVSKSSIKATDVTLLNDWSASQTLMEEELGKTSESKRDVYWIHVIKSTKKAETNEYIKTNIFSDSTAINKRITPYRNAERWTRFFLNDLEFASGEGNYNLEGTDTYNSKIDKAISWEESDDLISKSIYDGFIYNLVFDECYGVAKNINGRVGFTHCGVKKIGLLKEISYNNDKFGRNSVSLQLIGLR